MSKWTGNIAREVVGVGGVLNLKHGGPTKRPVENSLKGLDDYSPHTTKTPEDLRREIEERKRVEREAEAQKALERHEKGW